MSDPVLPEPRSAGPTDAAAIEGLSTELWLSTLLRYGVATSISVVLAGTSVLFWRHPEYSASAESLQKLTHPEQTAHSLSELIARSTDSPGQTMIMFGLLLLMSLPVARVVMSLYLFRLAGDRTYVKITGGVLVLLAVSFVVGLLHG